MRGRRVTNVMGGANVSSAQVHPWQHHLHLRHSTCGEDGLCAGHERPADDSRKEGHAAASIEPYEIRKSHSQFQLVSFLHLELQITLHLKPYSISFVVDPTYHHSRMLLVCCFALTNKINITCDLTQYFYYCCLSSSCKFYLHVSRHADREAEPKNYDVTKSDIDERDLLRATYNRIGNITDGVS